MDIIYSTRQFLSTHYLTVGGAVIALLPSEYIKFIAAFGLISSNWTIPYLLSSLEGKEIKQETDTLTPLLELAELALSDFKKSLATPPSPLQFQISSDQLIKVLYPLLTVASKENKLDSIIPPLNSLLETLSEAHPSIDTLSPSLDSVITIITDQTKNRQSYFTRFFKIGTAKIAQAPHSFFGGDVPLELPVNKIYDLIDLFQSDTCKLTSKVRYSLLNMSLKKVDNLLPGFSDEISKILGNNPLIPLNLPAIKIGVDAQLLDHIKVINTTKQFIYHQVTNHPIASIENNPELCKDFFNTYEKVMQTPQLMPDHELPLHLLWKQRTTIETELDKMTDYLAMVASFLLFKWVFLNGDEKDQIFYTTLHRIQNESRENKKNAFISFIRDSLTDGTDANILKCFIAKYSFDSVYSLFQFFVGHYLSTTPWIQIAKNQGVDCFYPFLRSILKKSGQFFRYFEKIQNDAFVSREDPDVYIEKKLMELEPEIYQDLNLDLFLPRIDLITRINSCYSSWVEWSQTPTNPIFFFFKQFPALGMQVALLATKFPMKIIESSLQFAMVRGSKYFLVHTPLIETFIASFSSPSSHSFPFLEITLGYLKEIDLLLKDSSKINEAEDVQSKNVIRDFEHAIQPVLEIIKERQSHPTSFQDNLIQSAYPHFVQKTVEMMDITKKNIAQKNDLNQRILNALQALTYLCYNSDRPLTPAEKKETIIRSEELTKQIIFYLTKIGKTIAKDYSEKLSPVGISDIIEKIFEPFEKISICQEKSEPSSSYLKKDLCEKIDVTLDLVKKLFVLRGLILHIVRS